MSNVVRLPDFAAIREMINNGRIERVSWRMQRYIRSLVNSQYAAAERRVMRRQPPHDPKPPAA